MTRSILVTGGLGFIGSHLCDHLLETSPEDRLVVVDDLSGTRLDVSPLVARADVTPADLRDFDPGERRFDEIYHLASPVGSLGILARHGRIAIDILELADAVARVAADAPARLLYLSSSEVYGRDGRHDEAAELLVPARRGTRMEYALGKLAAEHALLNLADDRRFETRVVRPFNVVGPWQSETLGFVVPTFLEAALAGRPLRVFGDGSQRRAFCDVRDLVRGIVAVQRHGRAGEVYNVGNPDNLVTVEALAERVRATARAASPIEHVDPRSIHGPRYLEAFDKIPDIDKVVRETGWAPRLGLDAILAELLAFHARGDRHARAERSHAALRARAPNVARPAPVGTGADADRVARAGSAASGRGFE